MIDCIHFSGLDLCAINERVCLRCILFTFHCPYQQGINKNAPNKWYLQALDKVN